MNKMTTFDHNGIQLPVRYTDTQHIKEGVDCDLYEFVNDTSKDLAIIHVAKGFSTPLQKVVKGSNTLEGHVAGSGILSVEDVEGKRQEYTFPSELENEVVVKIGQIMQWRALEDLVFYEICEPPYEEGRFLNLS